jgi:hypothetical protein
MQVLLEAYNVDVKPKNLCGEGMLAGKFLRALNSTLPGRDRHRQMISAVASELPSAVTNALRWW